MNIVITGSLGNISKPLAEKLVHRGHFVTVISSQTQRQAAIEALGAKAAIGTMQDINFLSQTFAGADVLYLMETLDHKTFFDPHIDVLAKVNEIVLNYMVAVRNAGVKRIIHLSGLGAEKSSGIGNLLMHHNAEKQLNQLPEEIGIKFIRAASFYTNTFGFIKTVKSEGAIVSNYGGDVKLPWVSPLDIAQTIADEMEKPFAGREVLYVASDEVSPNEVAKVLGESIGMPELTWKVISDEQLLKNMLSAGFAPSVAKGFVEMQAAQGNGTLYEDYFSVQPELKKTKFKDFAKQFANAYKNNQS